MRRPNRTHEPSKLSTGPQDCRRTSRLRHGSLLAVESFSALFRLPLPGLRLRIRPAANHFLRADIADCPNADFSFASKSREFHRFLPIPKVCALEFAPPNRRRRQHLHSPKQPGFEMRDSLQVAKSPG